MDTDFKFDNMKVRALDNLSDELEYTLNFTSDTEEKTIVLCGKGSIKETVKI